MVHTSPELNSEQRRETKGRGVMKSKSIAIMAAMALLGTGLVREAAPKEVDITPDDPEPPKAETWKQRERRLSARARRWTRRTT